MKRLQCLFLFGLTTLLSTNVFADKWQTVGTRSMGMGGTGVAISHGPDAQYYNPALLATDSQKNNSIVLNMNAELETTEKILKVISKVQSMTDDYQAIIDKINNNDYANAKDIMSIIDTLEVLQELDVKHTGTLVHANAGLSSKINKLAISVRSYGSAGVTPIVDKKNLGLSKDDIGIKIDNFSEPTIEENKNTATIIKNALDRYNLTDSVANLFGVEGKSSQELANAIVNMTNSAASSIKEIQEMAKQLEEKLPNISEILQSILNGNSYKDNESQILVDAGVFTEVSVGYGVEIISGLQVGGNIKYIQGQMAQSEIMILKDDQKIEEKIAKAFDNTKTSNQVGIDLGILVDISKITNSNVALKPKLGVTARNINNPFFERPEKPVDSGEKSKWNEDKYYLGSQLRAGLAINPIEKLIVACDVDLIKNETFVKEFDSQQLSFGIEYLLVNKPKVILPLRAGMAKNIASDKSEIEYTFGTGIMANGFIFELAAGMSSKTTTIDGNEVPTNASFALNLGYCF